METGKRSLAKAEQGLEKRNVNTTNKINDSKIEWKNIPLNKFVLNEDSIIYKINPTNLYTTITIKKVRKLIVESHKIKNRIIGYVIKGKGKAVIITEEICAGIYYTIRILPKKQYTIIHKNSSLIIYSNGNNYFILKR